MRKPQLCVYSSSRKAPNHIGYSFRFRVHARERYFADVAMPGDRAFEVELPK